MQKIGLAALAAFLLWCLFVWLRDIRRFVTVEYRVEARGLRRPFTFVLLSDLHNKQYGRDNRKLADAVLATAADAVLIAGDMYTAQRLPASAPAGEELDALCREQFRGAVALLRRIAGHWPIYYANGNHESRTGRDEDAYGPISRLYREELRALGIRPLQNEHVFLPEAGLDIYGLELELSCFRHFRKAPLTKEELTRLLGKPREDACRLLIAHNPDYFPEYAAWGADVVVSGHVHGGVVRLPLLGGVLSPALRLFPRYDGGLFRQNGARMILSRGLGMHTIPLRLWNPAELVVVHLEPEQPHDAGKKRGTNTGSLVKPEES